jgi:hypothetical protein
VAILLPYREGGDSHQEQRLREILSSGHIAPSEKRFLGKPALIKGQGPLPSDLISHERR